MANSKIDNQMERMQFLMEYKTTPKVDTKAGIEYSINTADGKTYGIIRENNMYYVKTTTPDKAAIKESYEYLGGYNYRNEHGYKSFNEATKHLELEVMCINEAYGKHEDVSVTLNSNKRKEDFQALTEAARTELDRMHQIFENSGNIGHYNNPYGDPESKGKASAENTTKNNAPFEDKAEATLDKDPKFNGTVDGATPDNKDVKVTDAELGSDKMKTGNSGSEKDFKDAHDDLDGEGVADKHPSGAKAVKMNESMLGEEPEFSAADFETGEEPIEEPVDVPVEGGDVPLEEPVEGDDLAGFEGDDITLGDFGYEDGRNELDELLETLIGPELNVGDVTGQKADGDMSNTANIGLTEEEGKEDILKGDPSTLEGDAGNGDNNVHGEETMDRIDEEENQKPEGAGEKESKIVGPDGVMDSEEGAGSLPAQTWDKLQESIDRITDSIYNRLREGQGWNKFKDVWSRRAELPGNDKEYDEFVDDGNVESWIENGGRSDSEPVDAPYYDKYGDATDSKYDKNGMRHGQIGTGFMDKLGRRAAVTAAKGLAKGNVALNKLKNRFTPASKEEAYLQEALDRIVAEEVKKLDAWGKHPRYQKPAFQTPENTEVNVNGSEDWNDDSTKGEEAYGKKIGSSAPFDKTVDMLTDAVVNMIKEQYGLKKK